jgi:hypothetical protein
MTLTGLVVRNALRNQRRTVPTILSIGFSMLLLTIMMTLWRTSTSMNWARPQLSACLPGPHVFFSYAMPNDYREKNRSVPGAVAVAPLNIFNKVDKDNKAENAFPQGGTDPDEFLKVCRDDEIPQDQVIAWQKDRAGTIVEDALAWQQGWKLGDRIVIQGKFFPVNLELNIRGIYKPPVPARGIWFNWKYEGKAVLLRRMISTFFCRTPLGMCLVSNARWTRCSATLPSRQKRKAKRISSSILSPSAMCRRSFSASAWRRYSPSCWFQRTPWRCRFGSATGRSR